MPWKETNVMYEKTQFINAMLTRQGTVLQDRGRFYVLVSYRFSAGADFPPHPSCFATHLFREGTETLPYIYSSRRDTIILHFALCILHLKKKSLLALFYVPKETGKIVWNCQTEPKRSEGLSEDGKQMY